MFCETRKIEKHYLFVSLLGALIALPCGWSLWTDYSRASERVDLLMAKRRAPISLIGIPEIQRVFDRRVSGIAEDRILDLSLHLYELSEAYDFDPAFILSLIHVESSFRAQAISKAGARGLMQVMPNTGRYIANKEGFAYKSNNDLFDPFLNLSIGIDYLAELRDRFHGNYFFMLAAYNAGPTKIKQLMAKTGYRFPITFAYYQKITDLIEPFRLESLGYIENAVDEVSKTRI